VDHRNIAKSGTDVLSRLLNQSWFELFKTSGLVCVCATIVLRTELADAIAFSYNMNGNQISALLTHLLMMSRPLLLHMLLSFCTTIPA
jgi:hypothetical protein